MNPTKNDKKHWFKRRRFGSGWVPVTWQGWGVLIGFFVVVVGVSSQLPKMPTTRQTLEYLIFFVVALIIMLMIIFRTSPSPRWRWGRKDTDDPDEDF